MQQEHQALISQVDILTSGLTASKQAVEELEAAVDQSAAHIDSLRVALDRYDSQAVAYFNREVQQHNKQVRALRNVIADHNRSVRQARKAAYRLKEVEQALDETGETYE